MSVPGFDTVGAIYVKVLTDTSGMGKEIEAAAKKAGKEGGDKSAEEFDDAFQKKINKKMFDRAFDKQIDATAKKFANKINSEVGKGSTHIDLKLDPKFAKQVRAEADRLGLDFNEVTQELVGKLGNAVDKELDRIEQRTGKLGGKMNDTFKRDISLAALDNEIDQAAKDIATKFPDALEKGLGRSSIQRQFGAQFKAIANEFGTDIDSVATRVSGRVPAMIRQLEKERVAAAEKQAKELQRQADEAARQRRADAAKLQRAADAARKKADAARARDDAARKRELDALQKFLRGVDFSGAIGKLADNLEKELTPAVQNAFSIDSTEKLGDDLDRRMQLVADHYGESLDNVQSRVSGRMDNRIRDMQRHLIEGLKDINVPIGLDEGNLQAGIIRTAKSVRKTLTPAMQKALREGQDIDWTLSKDAEDDIDRLSKNLGMSLTEATKHVTETIRRDVEHEEALKIKVKIDSPDDRDVDNRRNRLKKLFDLDLGSEKLFKAGGGRFSRIASSLLAIPLKLGELLGGVVKGAVKLVGKGFESIGNFLTKGGEALSKFGNMFAKFFSGALQKAGGWISKFGAMLGKAGGPIGAIVAVSAAIIFLNMALGAMVILVKAAAGVILNFVGMVAMAAAALVPMGFAAASAAIGLGVLVIGAKDAFGAMKLLNTAIGSDKAEDWDKYNEAMAKLGPNAKAAVKATEPLLRVFKDLKKDLGERIFADTAAGIAKLEGTTKIIKDGLLGVADGVNAVVKGFIDLGNDTTFQSNLTTIFASAKPIVEDFGNAIRDVFAGLISVWATLSPLAEKIAQSIANAAASFREWVGQEENQKKIVKFFEDAWAAAVQLKDLLVAVGGLLGALFTAANEANLKEDSLINQVIAKLNEWTEWLNDPANKAAVDEFFENAKEVAIAVWEAIKEIGQSLNDLDTPENRAALDTIISLIGDIGVAIQVLAVLADVLLQPFNLLKGIVKQIYDWTVKILEVIGLIDKKMPTVAAGAYDAQRNIGLPAAGVPSSSKSRPFANPALAAGGLVNRATMALVGEAGPELVVPLRRPIGLIDPAARPAARWLQDKEREKHTSGPQKVVNLTQNITPAQADPAAVAASVINRAVAVARG